MLCVEGVGHDGVLAGKVGRDVDRYLDGYHIPFRSDIFVTSLYREYGGKDYEYTAEDFARDEPDLLDEIRRVQPEVVITLGRGAARYFLGDVDMEDVHALPWIRPGTTGPVVFPIFNPAAGYHSPEIQSYVQYGFGQLGLFLEGTIHARTLYEDPIPAPNYREITRAAEIRLLSGQCVSIDTEGYPHKPWSLQYSQVAGEGRLIRADNGPLLRAFGRVLRNSHCRVVYHSALHDLAMMRALGIPVDDIPFDDTMVMAYLLQIEPQGLKPLCIRHCNMAMQSYADVLGDATQRLALDYLVSLWDIEEYEHAERCEDEFHKILSTPCTDKAGKTKFRKLKVHPKLPRTPLHKAVERCLRSKDAHKLWHDQLEDIQVAGYRKWGPMPDASLSHVPAPVALHYGCRDADGTTRLCRELGGRLDSMGLRPVYDLELSTYPLIDRMAAVGILPDLAHFRQLSTQLGHELSDIQATIADATGSWDFNANSHLQVGDLLFNTLGLEGGKKTSEGHFSTNDKILEGLEHEHPQHTIISAIRGYREVYKLKHTFVDRIPDFVARWPHDGRIHATFRTTRVVTGRLAASDPNILALPKHGKFAKGFRRGFVAAPGHVLGEWDLSQIELRGLAHLSQDPIMLAIFRGEKRNPDGSLIDLHAALAERIFGVKPKDQDKSKHRLPAKAVNFGIPMGMTCKGLTVELRKNGVMVDEDDAQRWIDETDALYKGVPAYKQDKIAEARRNGYVRCLSGRIRYIGGIRSPHEQVRAEAERFAFSTPIQESAQYVMKTAEAYVWQHIILPLQADGHWIEPLMQVHDALTLEFENEQLARDVHPMMVHAMTQTFDGLSVPIETSGDWGYNLCDQEAF